MKVDMSSEKEIICAFDECLNKHGPVHVLVNNAGILVNTSLNNADVKQLQKALDLNVMSVAIASREAIKQMTDCKIDGHIVQIASILGYFIPEAGTNSNIYTACKHAVVAIADTLRLELANAGSKINICVGNVLFH